MVKILHIQKILTPWDGCYNPNPITFSCSLTTLSPGTLLIQDARFDMQIISVIFQGEVITVGFGSDCRKTIKDPIFGLLWLVTGWFYCMQKWAKSSIGTFSTVSQASLHLPPSHSPDSSLAVLRERKTTNRRLAWILTGYHTTRVTLSLYIWAILNFW